MGFCHSQEIYPTNLEKKLDTDTKIELDDTKIELLQRK